MGFLQKIDDMTIKERNTLTLFTVIVADTILTLYLLVNGFTEANPILNSFIAISNEIYMAISKIILSCVVLIIVFKRKESDIYIKWGLRAYLIIYSICILVQWGILYSR